MIITIQVVALYNIQHIACYINKEQAIRILSMQL